MQFKVGQTYWWLKNTPSQRKFKIIKNNKELFNLFWFDVVSGYKDVDVEIKGYTINQLKRWKQTGIISLISIYDPQKICRNKK